MEIGLIRWSLVLKQVDCESLKQRKFDKEHRKYNDKEMFLVFYCESTQKQS